MLSDQWGKSSFSEGSSGCVEARRTPNGVEMRDTKEGPEATVQTYTPDEWAAFVRGVRAGEFDL